MKTRLLVTALIAFVTVSGESDGRPSASSVAAIPDDELQWLLHSYPQDAPIPAWWSHRVEAARSWASPRLSRFALDVFAELGRHEISLDDLWKNDALCRRLAMAESAVNLLSYWKSDHLVPVCWAAMRLRFRVGEEWTPLPWVSKAIADLGASLRTPLARSFLRYAAGCSDDCVARDAREALAASMGTAAARSRDPVQ